MKIWIFEGRKHIVSGKIRAPQLEEIFLSIADFPMRCITDYPEDQKRRILKRIKPGNTGSQAQIAWNQRAEDD